VNVKAAEFAEPQLGVPAYNRDSIIRFDEGLIGLADCKHFVLAEDKLLQPFRLFEYAGSRQMSFVVLDPTVRVPDYYDQIPDRDWESIGVTRRDKRLAFVIVNIGLGAHDSTANFQAPLLINFEKMTGRQVILTDSDFCLRTPLLG
jgi:flagellar assembly factor FliW